MGVCLIIYSDNGSTTLEDHYTDMSSSNDYVWVWSWGEHDMDGEWPGEYLEYDGSYNGNIYNASSFTSMIDVWYRNRAPGNGFNYYGTTRHLTEGNYSNGFA